MKARVCKYAAAKVPAKTSKSGCPTMCAGPIKYERRWSRGIRTEFYCEAHGDWYAAINPFGGLVQIRLKETT